MQRRTRGPAAANGQGGLSLIIPGDEGATVADPDHEAVFRRLFDTHFDGLARFAFRYVGSVEEAEDVVHDVFLRVWARRDRFPDIDNERAYLYTLARNQALDRLRQRRVRARYGAAEVAEQSGTIPGGDERLVEDELTAALERAVDALPGRQREILLLRWREQASYDEIGRRLGISVKTVAVHVGRALQRLRETVPRLVE